MPYGSKSIARACGWSRDGKIWLEAPMAGSCLTAAVSQFPRDADIPITLPTSRTRWVLNNWCKSTRTNEIPSVQGCIYQFSDDLREQLIILGSIGLGICVTKIFGIVLACSLFIKLKNLYEHSANQTPVNLLARDRVSFIYGIDDSDDERLPDPPSSANRNSFRPDFSESNISNRPNSIYDRRV